MTDIFDELNVPEKRRTPEYRNLLMNGDQYKGIGVSYGPVYYQGNEKCLQQLERSMSPAAFALAEQMAEEFDDEE